MRMPVSKRFIKSRPLHNECGVTLVEMMIYMVIAGMLLALAVTAFLGQNKSYNRQDIIAEIQQNIRGATEQISSDIRFAGIGLLETSHDAFALADYFSFSVNYWSDLDDYWRSDVRGKEKTVGYRLENNNLQRNYRLLTESTFAADEWLTLAENIEQLRFEYLLEISGAWVWKGNVPSGELENIRAVKIMLLGSARPSFFNQTDSSTYNFPLDQSGATFVYTPLAGTGYKRLMSTIVQARNNRN